MFEDKNKLSEANEPAAQYRTSQPIIEVEKPKKVSLAEYLEMIDDGERRLEFHDGEVIDIQSATEQHGKICTNITTFVNVCLIAKDKDCDIYAGDRELWLAKCNKMFYPDHVIVCGEHDMKQMSKNVKATINPSVVIEVLSDSTKKYDEMTKLRCYKTLESLKQIVFVSQEEKHVRTLTKQDRSRGWLDIDYFEEDEMVEIGDCEIAMNDIYRRVNFENTTGEIPVEQ
jgi:Uma2 family endonuclease